MSFHGDLTAVNTAFFERPGMIPARLIVSREWSNPEIVLNWAAVTDLLQELPHIVARALTGLGFMTKSNDVAAFKCEVPAGHRVNVPLIWIVVSPMWSSALAEQAERLLDAIRTGVFQFFKKRLEDASKAVGIPVVCINLELQMGCGCEMGSRGEAVASW